MEEGKNKFVAGLLITVSAVVTVVVVAASWGTATPVAASAWGNAIILTSAGMSTAYGMSEMVEGVDLYRLGAEGDTITIAKNPVRDVVFGGNEDLYHMWGEANVFIMNVSTMAAGVSGAYKTGGVKSVLAELGKIGLSGGAGAGTEWFLEEKLGMDQTDALLAGFAVSTATYAGLNRLQGNVAQRYRVNDADGTVTSYADLMSPEDAARYLKFLETGSTEGLTAEELLGIRKVEEYLALGRVDYDEVLALRRGGYEGGSKAELGNKLDYQFGNAGGNKHNIDRTNGLKAEMDKLGFADTVENRAYFQQYYNDVLNDSSNIVGVPQTASYTENGVTCYYTVTTKESFLMGKYGGAKVTTHWDGNRLLTIIISSGKQTRYNP